MCTAVACTPVNVVLPDVHALLCGFCSCAGIWAAVESYMQGGARNTDLLKPTLRFMLVCSFGVLLWELMTGDRPKRAQLRAVRSAAEAAHVADV